MSTLHERISGLSPEKRTLLAMRLLKKNEAGTNRLAIPKRPAGDTAPLSFAQQRLWFLTQLEPDSPFYNVPTVLRFRGRLEVSSLQQSLSELVQRHEILRTTFVTVDGQPVQVIAPPAPVALPVGDLRHLPPARREATAHQLALAEAQQPFDLSNGPLLRVRLLQLDTDDYLALFTMHHIITDGWSIDILLREVVTLYTTACAGETSPLPDLPIQYADFAVWQREWLQGDILEQQLAYWRQQLQGAPPLLELPTDRPRPVVQNSRGATHSFALPASLADALRHLSQQNDCTLFMTLLAAFQVLLSRYSGQTDICVGTPIANRTRAELEPLIGFFVNTLVLRSDLSANPAFRTLLQQVREVTLGAYAHQDVPFELLVDTLKPARSLSHSPLFQVMFTLETSMLAAQSLPDLTLEPVTVESGTAKFDLTLSLIDEPGALEGQIEYNTDLFDATTIARMAGHFATLLAGIVADPDQSIASLPVLTDAERHQLLVVWNATAVSFPQTQSIHQLVEAQAQHSPDVVAVVSQDQRLCYGELNTRANQLAHYLHQHGVGSETPVGLCVDRSSDLVVGALGILKAGAAYMALDPATPPARIAAMLADAQAPVVLTRQSLVLALRTAVADTTQIIALDADWPAIAQAPDINPDTLVTPDQLAYVIFTSGSTGQPKGVLIPYRGLCNLIQWHQQTFGVTAADRATQVAGTGFDASVWEIWPYLTAGASLYFPDEAKRMNPVAMRDWLVDEGITLTFLPTPLAEQIVTLPWPATTALRYLLTGGDVLHQSPPVTLPFRLVNNYGPTEYSVVTTSGVVSAKTDAVNSPTIGRPIANTQVYLLDAHQQPVPIGVPGELHIGGAGIAQGYLNRPELTAEKFIPNPFSCQPDARLYRTGDLVRYMPDGNIEFLGRIDTQVKIRGFRIELGEIEAIISQYTGVQAVVVLALEDTPGDKRLVAYIVPSANQHIASSELKTWLQDKLPAYMIPTAFVLLETLPLNQNGKVDRRALPMPDRSVLVTQHSIDMPRDTLETELVHIWAEILNLGSVGIRDNFFDLGGHSLLAVQLLAQIEQRLGRQISMMTFFQNPTIEHLAAEIRQQGATAHTSLLVEFQPGSDNRLPIFFIHPSGGSVHWYTDLARYIGSDQPFYGLQAQGLHGDEELHTRIEDMAAHYIALIQTVQPVGPYMIGSWSLGVVIAFEMAQQLYAQHQEVALLALLDQGPILPLEEDEDDAAFMLNVFEWKLPLSLEELRQLEPDQQYQCVLDAAKQNDLILPHITYPQFHHFIFMLKTQIQAWRDYLPKPYAGKITLFQATEQTTRNSASSQPTAHTDRSKQGLFAPRGPLIRLLSSLRSRQETPASDTNEEVLEQDMGWGKLAAGGVDVYQVPGDHRSMVFNPHVRVLARRMRECIDIVHIEKSYRIIIKG